MVGNRLKGSNIGLVGVLGVENWGNCIDEVTAKIFLIVLLWEKRENNEQRTVKVCQ